MIVMGVMCILIGILGIWMGNVFYREARTDLPFSDSKKCVKQGNFFYTIGTITLLIGVFLIIGILL